MGLQFLIAIFQRTKHLGSDVHTHTHIHLLEESFFVEKWAREQDAVDKRGWEVTVLISLILH